MSYLPVVSRNIGDTSQGYEYAGVDDEGKTVMEELDGKVIGPFHANGIEIHNDKKIGYLETSLSDIDIEVYVTSSRVIIRCDKYDKGSRHWRGGFSALALNAIERGIGKARSKGKVLIGHMRYEWIAQILYQNKYSFFYVDNMVSFDYVECEENRLMRLRLNFKKDVDTEKLANDILTRICIYRKMMTDDKDEKLLKVINEYSQAENKIPQGEEKNEYPHVGIPDICIAPYGFEYRPVVTEQTSSGELVTEDESIVKDESGVVSDVSSDDDDETILKHPDIEILYVKPSCSDVDMDDDKTVLLEKEKPVLKLIGISDEIVFEPDKEIFILGRSREKSDFHIDNKAVSGIHAKIKVTEEGVNVEDMDSSNHTYVNEEMLEAGVVKALDNGDILKLANEEFKVEIKYPEQGQALLNQVKDGYFVIKFNNGDADVEIHKNTFTLGRTRGGADVVVSDSRNIGRIHAVLRVDSGSEKIYIRDEDSANGTFLNGIRLGKGTEMELSSRDEIKLSDVSISFFIE